MLNESQRIQLISKLNENIRFLESLEVEEFVNEKRLGEINSFQKARMYFVNVKNIGKKLKNCQIESLSERKLEALNRLLFELTAILQNIKSYDPDNRSAGNRDQLINELDRIYADFLDFLIPIITFLSSEPNELSIILNRANEIVKSMEHIYTEIIEKKKISYENADRMLNDLKELSAESGVTKYNSIFADEANDNKKKANYWLISTIILGIISLVIAYLFLSIHPSEENPTSYVIVQYAITKIIVFTIIYYLLVLFVKNYNAHRHNYIVNKHRQNALLTFSTFVSSALDNETKNAVLLRATQSIFATQMSGYLKNENEIDNPNKIIEIIKNISSTKP